MTVVVNASVAVKWYVKEVHDEEAELLLNGAFDLHAPELAIPEFGNIIWKKCRNGQISNGDARKITEAFLNQNFTFHSHRKLLKSAFFGALATRQTVYDWSYLALAVSLSCKCVTADARFYKALEKTEMKRHLLWVEDLPEFCRNHSG